MAAPIGKIDVDELEELCEIEATVTTGFECIAKEEVEDKLGVEVRAERGHIFFNIPVEIVKRIKEITTVDNLFVVIKHCHKFQFKEEKTEALNQLVDLIPSVNWELGLRVWHKFYEFPHPISPNAQINSTVHSPDSNTTSTENIDSGVNTESQKSGKNIELESSQKVSSALGDSPSSEPEAKRQKTWNPLLPAFRVTCYRSNAKHCFSSMEAAHHFGGNMQDYFGWNVSMKNFDIETVLTVDGDHVYVGIALTKESLHRRNIAEFGPTCLRPTLACAMLRVCKIKPGEVVCDPMCGGGTIPIEASINWPEAYHICGELHEKAVARSHINIEAVKKKRRESQRKPIEVDLFHWDAMKLPLKDNLVDVFITDLPFGKRSGSKMRNWHLYPKVLDEMSRVCKPETGRACLLTQDKKCMSKVLQSVSQYWKKGNFLWINIGGLAAGVYMLYRNNKPFIT